MGRLKIKIKKMGRQGRERPPLETARIKEPSEMQVPYYHAKISIVSCERRSHKRMPDGCYQLFMIYQGANHTKLVEGQDTFLSNITQ